MNQPYYNPRDPRDMFQNPMDNFPHQNMNPNQMEPEEQNYVEAPIKRYPFGKKPFGSNEDPYEEPNERPFQNDKPNIIYVKADNDRKSNKQDKDPDVWDPPSPKYKKGIQITYFLNCFRL